MPAAIGYTDRVPTTADLVIIGGGVVGAATAFYAARAGLRPLVVERRASLCSLTTAAAAGSFRLQFDNRDELELVRRSVDLLLHFADVTGQRDYDPQIQQQGYLWLTTEERMAERQRHLVATQRGWGLDDVELLAGEAVRRRFPYVSERVLQARFRQGDGFLDPRQLAMGLIAASGATVALDCAVQGLRIAGARLTAVETSAGAIATETAVIAGGPFSRVLGAYAGLDLPLSAVRRQKVVLPDVPLVPRNAPMTIDEDTGTHWRPVFSGAYLLFADPATPPTPPLDDVTPEREFGYRLLDPASPRAVARVSPFWREVWERNVAHWTVQAGQYTMTPDHKPIIGPTAIDGVYVNTGYSGHGVMAGPGGSATLIEILIGARSPAEHAFRVNRPFLARETDAL